MLSLKFKRCARSVTVDDIDADITDRFPGYDDFKNLYVVFNGGSPNKNVTTGVNNYSIRYFYSIKYNYNEHRPTINYINSKFRAIKVIGSFFNKKLIFAVDDGSNQFCIDINTGNILYVPFDMGDELSNVSTVIANSFNEFLGCLEYYSIIYHDSYYNDIWEDME